MKIRQKRHPEWLKVPLPAGKSFHQLRKLVNDHKLHTVCQTAHCPNIGECWGQRTATFMILGDICTRNCRFCNVKSGLPQPVDIDEPNRVAAAVKTLSLKYVVITSVTRDDVPDGGASIFADTILEIRKLVADCRIEVLIPDFNGSPDALKTVFEVKPDVLNHNLETIPVLYEQVRPAADYNRSLEVLKLAKSFGLTAKSGLMLGLGENKQQIVEVMRDLRKIGCDFLTLGQYLQPSLKHVPIERYVSPEEFEELKNEGLRLGFNFVEAGPLVRSSYHAATSYNYFKSEKEKTNLVS